MALLKRIVGGLRKEWPEVAIELRADAGFAVPALYDYCEAEGITYTVGLITNPRLEQLAEDLLDEAEERYETEGEKTRGSFPKTPTRPEAGSVSVGSSTRPRRWSKGPTPASS